MNPRDKQRHAHGNGDLLKESEVYMATKLKISDISNEFYELSEVINVLGTSQRNVFWLIKRDKEFPETYKLGSRSIWKRSDIEAYRKLRWRRKNTALRLWERWLASDDDKQIVESIPQ